MTGSMLSLRSYNPVVKVLAPVPAMVVAGLSRDLWTPAALTVIALVMLLALGRLRGRVLFWTLAGPPLLVALLTLSFGVWADQSKVGGWSGAFEVGLATGLRVAAVLTLALIAGLTTEGADLVRSMITHLRMPYRIGYAGFAAMRFVPRFRDDLEIIRLAHRVRGAGTGRGPVATARRYSGYVVPLLAGAMRHGDRVSLAMEARGFGAYPARTERRRVPMRARDAVLAVWLLLLCFVPHLSGVLG
ncbi:MAG TPA: energy-coupling factor transporter transmembrane component T [Actinoplanes sp.]|nr:energy-coupling factor transporter transmembrane component T [Actinoplanes sp.]